MSQADEPIGWSELTVHGLLQRAATRWPDREALVTPRERLTFQEALTQANALACGLLRAGIRPADRVATLFSTRAEWVLLQYAIAGLGATLVPLNVRLQPSELLYALAKTAANALVAMDCDGKHDLLSLLHEACPELPSAQRGRVRSDTLPSLRLAVCFSPARRYDGHLLPFDELAEPPSRQESESLAAQVAKVAPQATAVIMFTSGSTSLPKGVMLSHTNLIGHAHYLSLWLRMTPDDRYLNLLPFYHIAGYTQSVLMPHYAGSMLCLVDRFAPVDVLAAMQRERITAWAGMPVTIQRILDRAQEVRADLSSLRKQHGVSAELWDRVAHETDVNLLTRMYGLTESAGLVSMTPPQEEDCARRRESVGTPLPGVSVRIADPQTNEELPTGQAGEIAFDGWNRFTGYYDEPALTAETIDASGFCHTGDQGYFDEAGRLHLLGRYKDLVRTGGENVSQAEVELCLQQCIPGLKSVAVVGVPDPVWGEAVTAVVELACGSDVNAETLRACCQGRMASFKAPRHVLLMPPGGWPLTHTGKVDKRRLRAWAMAELGIISGA